MKCHYIIISLLCLFTGTGCEDNKAVKNEITQNKTTYLELSKQIDLMYEKLDSKYVPREQKQITREAISVKLEMFCESFNKMYNESGGGHWAINSYEQDYGWLLLVKNDADYKKEEELIVKMFLDFCEVDKLPADIVKLQYKEN